MHPRHPPPEDRIGRLFRLLDEGGEHPRLIPAGFEGGVGENLLNVGSDVSLIGHPEEGSITILLFDADRAFLNRSP